MVSKKVLFPTTIAIALGLFIAYNEKMIDDVQKNAPLFYVEELDMDWAELAKKGFGKCHRPMVMRNAFKYPNDNACVKEDSCQSYIKGKLLEYFGERTIQAFPHTHVTISDNQTHQIDQVNIPLEEFYNNPKYDRHMIHTLQQLGTQDEYQMLLGMGADPPLNSFYDMTNLPGYTYLGSQTFMGQEKTGSSLHFAPITNVFVMLSGRKRWILVSPHYLYQAKCSWGKLGLYGNCYPGEYYASYGNISAEYYKDVLLNAENIPPEYIVDITLNPGDVFINCILWPHAVENLTPTTSAFTMRYHAKLSNRVFQVANWKIVLDGMFKGLREKIRNPSSFTMIDILSYEPHFLDKDPRFSQVSVMNQNKGGSDATLNKL